MTRGLCVCMKKQKGAITGLDWTGLDWTGLDWTGRCLPYCASSSADDAHTVSGQAYGAHRVRAYVWARVPVVWYGAVPCRAVPASPPTVPIQLRTVFVDVDFSDTSLVSLTCLG